MNRSKRAVFALTLATWLTCIAQAHETFLLPTGNKAGDRSVVLSSTEHYPSQDFGPKIERIAGIAANGPDPTAALVPVRNGDKAMSLTLQASVPGTYALSLELMPRDLDLTPDKVQEYFDEIDASDSLRKSYLDRPEPRTWHETYTKFSRSFLCISECGDMSALEHPGGMKVEFRLSPRGRADASRALVLLRDGSPVGDLPVGVFGEDGSKDFVKTGRDGTLPIPTGFHGTVLLSAVILEPIPNAPGQYRSAFCTLTITPQVLSALR